MFNILKRKGLGNSNFDLDTYQPMPVIYQLRYTILEKIEKGEEVLSEIDGRRETKNDVLRAILSGAHPYLVSEEGTGKTRLARSLTRLLPPILVIKGCPYNDDPKWPREWLCPRCQRAKDPIKQYGIEILPGEKRFSRIQGNEYTNEAKLLGLKDIQAIAHGMSPSDPGVFTGTGVFRANRGILFIDELPAIRTKVQVLLHPILEEGKAVLEEYNWERPVDLLLIATGNPRGFSHVNEIPRPLLDRLEMIYMDMPEESIEKTIMLKERFRVDSHSYYEKFRPSVSGVNFQFPVDRVERKVIAPWWIMEIVNKSVRYTRLCPKLDRKASIRGTSRAIDHTYASVELEGRNVAHLGDACQGLKLSLRGRIGLRPELVDFEDPRRTFRNTERVIEDIMRNAVIHLGQEIYPEMVRATRGEAEKLTREVESLCSRRNIPRQEIVERLGDYPIVEQLVDWLKKIGPEHISVELLEPWEKKIYLSDDQAEEAIIKEYNYSALEMIINVCVHKRLVNEMDARYLVFIPREFKSE